MIVRNTLLDDALAPTSGSVIVELAGPGHHAAGEASKRVVIDVDATGEWSADLTPNSEFRVAGTVYTVQQKPVLGRITYHTILVRTAAEAAAAGIVANDDESFDLWDLLTDPPAAPAPSGLVAHAEAEAAARTAGDAALQTQVDALNADLDVEAAARTAGDEARVLHVEHGTTLGTASVVAGEVVVTFTSPWGITAAGDPYYDPDGAAPGEEAVLVVNSDGSLTVVKPEGTV